jgi:hypothetical protein
MDTLMERLQQIAYRRLPEDCTIAIQGAGDHLVAMLHHSHKTVWEAAGSADCIIDNFQRWLVRRPTGWPLR